MHQKKNKGLISILLSLFLTILISSNALAITDSVPTMTSNTTPTGTVETNSILNATHDGWYAFDDNTSTYYSNYQYPPFNLGYAYPTPKIIDSYSITIGTGGYSPNAWTFQGFDGASWITLDTKTGQAVFNTNEERIYPITNSTAYQKYRINVTSTNAASRCYISELKFQEKIVDTVPPVSPQSLTSTIVYTDRIILNWLQNTESDFLKYRIVRDGVQLGYTTSSTYTDLDLLSGTNYNYDISAIDIYGNESSPSTIVVATAPPVEPSNIADDVTLQAISFQVGLILSSLVGFVFWITMRRL